jgi:hypothetical protein
MRRSWKTSVELGGSSDGSDDDDDEVGMAMRVLRRYMSSPPERIDIDFSAEADEGGFEAFSSSAKAIHHASRPCCCVESGVPSFIIGKDCAVLSCSACSASG